MPKFFYKARKGPKELEQGTIEAATEAAAISKLTQLGYFPISVSPEAETATKEKSRAPGFLRNIRHRDLVAFTRQLANLLESGLSLHRALTVLERQTENKSLQAIIQDIANLVKEGRSLSESLKRYPRAFNNMYVSMVSAGEVSGTLEKVLKRLADFGEKREDILARVQAAMAYPILMAVVGTATIIVLFTFVIPRLVGLFEDMDQILPLPTRMMMAVSDFLLNFWWFILALGLLAFFAIRRSLLTAKGKLSFDLFKLGLPVLGKFFQRVQIANFSRTLGTLLASGVPILQAMDSACQTLENEVFKEQLNKVTKEIKEGSSLAKGISKSKHFPMLAANMLSIGEEGGALEVALLKVAQIYEKETDQSIKLLTSLIEPVMILAMGFVVGFIVISMLLPIFQISLIAG
jgi:general secretion pathway protein F